MLGKTTFPSLLTNQNKPAKNFMVLVFLLSIVRLGHASVVLDFQAEDTPGYKPANSRWRSNAANVKSVLLQSDGDYLRFPICLPTDGLVSVEEVRYSTDGGSKTGAVLLDGEEIGTFETVDNTNFGFNWNLFNASGPFSVNTLTKGNHTIDVKLKTGSDHWGMEIDQIKIAFSSNITRQDITCQQDNNTISSGSNSSVSNTSTTSICTHTEHISMGNLNGNLILKKNEYNTCHENVYRLDLFTQSQVKGVMLNISHDGQDKGGCKPNTALISDSQTESPRKIVFSVGKADDFASCLQTNELAYLTSDAFFTFDLLNATLPARVDPAQLQNFSLQFSLPDISVADSFRFIMSISCPSGGQTQLALNITLLDMDSGDMVDKQQLLAKFQVGESGTKLSLAIPSFVRQAEVRILFVDSQARFVLNALTLDYPIRSKPTPYDLWLPTAQKRQVLFSYDGLRVEVVTMPGARQMAVRMRSTSTFSGGNRQFSGSRILVYTTQDDTSQLQMVFDQTSKSYFFPERDPSRQVSFNLGQPDPNGDFPDLQIVEVDAYGDRRLSLTLTQSGLSQRVIYISHLLLLTVVHLIDLTNNLLFALLAPQIPLFAAMVPCADNQLTNETLIKVDDTNSVPLIELQRMVTAQQLIELSWS